MHAEPSVDFLRPRSISMWLKISYTGFMAILVPYYWKEYGPTNFIYFCDIALFLTLAALWTEKRIYASMAAVGIVVPQLLWQIDFLGSLVGMPVANMTAYMFDEKISFFARFLSFFHFWVPLLLLYLVYQLGYDRRALGGWIVVAWCAMLIAYFFLPAPGDPLSHPNEPHNVNYVFGIDGNKSQTYMPGLAWLALMMIGMPMLIYAPTHWVLAHICHSGLPINSELTGETSSHVSP